MELRALVVDDEKPARDELKFLISGIEDIRVSGEADSSASAYEILKREEIDLVFLDIEMPGSNGFSLVEKILNLEKPPAVIFVTAYDQYAVKAFEAEAVDYILKPVSIDRLKQAVCRVSKRIRESPVLKKDFENIAKALSGIPSFERIVLEKRGRMILADPDDILFFESFGKDIEANLNDETLFVPRDITMDRLEERLGRGSFFRVHRSYLVNIKHIKEFYPFMGGKYEVVISNRENTKIPVSRSRVKAFKERLMI